MLNPLFELGRIERSKDVSLKFVDSENFVVVYPEDEIDKKTELQTQNNLLKGLKDEYLNQVTQFKAENEELKEFCKIFQNNTQLVENERYELEQENKELIKDRASLLLEGVNLQAENNKLQQLKQILENEIRNTENYYGKNITDSISHHIDQCKLILKDATK